MRLSVIIPIHGFDPNREVALKHLLNAVAEQDLRVRDEAGNPTEAKDFEVIIVEQQSIHDDWSGRKITSHIFDEKPYLRHIVLPPQEKGFNKSWCMNVGARQARTGRLVFLDMDMLFGKAFFSKIYYFASEPPTRRYFTCWNYIVSLPGKDQITRVITHDTMTAGGAFYIDAALFWEAGAMNECYYGYGAEDNDFWIRVNRMLGGDKSYNVSALPYALGHWYHDWVPASEERFYYLNRTVQHPDKVRTRLCATAQGMPDGPKPIDVSDIRLKEAGLETKEGKGIL